MLDRTSWGHRNCDPLALTINESGHLRRMASTRVIQRYFLRTFEQFNSKRGGREVDDNYITIAVAGGGFQSDFNADCEGLARSIQ